ncbi:hypothetical protein ONS96_014440 [Cadophora gregata f. sp. sojae]|nr:hypothetical protein ONS96_014440 [Cadophora gregata f. sp. sojae]
MPKVEEACHSSAPQPHAPLSSQDATSDPSKIHVPSPTLQSSSAPSTTSDPAVYECATNSALSLQFPLNLASYLHVHEATPSEITHLSTLPEVDVEYLRRVRSHGVDYAGVLVAEADNVSVLDSMTHPPHPLPTQIYEGLRRYIFRPFRDKYLLAMSLSDVHLAVMPIVNGLFIACGTRYADSLATKDAAIAEAFLYM